MNKPQLTRHKITIPSTGEEYEFTPFVSVYQKNILIAHESKDQESLFQTFKALIDFCFEGKLNYEKLTYTDLNYISMRLRMASIDEKLEMQLPCDCGAKDKKDVLIPITFDLNTIKMPVYNVKQKEVTISTGKKIMLRYPNFESVKKILDIKLDKNMSKYEKPSKIYAECIECVMDGDEVFYKQDMNMLEFIDNEMLPKEIQELYSFYNDEPNMEVKQKYECHECGKKDEFEFSGGLYGFFI